MRFIANLVLYVDMLFVRKLSVHVVYHSYHLDVIALSHKDNGSYPQSIVFIIKIMYIAKTFI